MRGSFLGPLILRAWDLGVVEKDDVCECDRGQRKVRSLGGRADLIWSWKGVCRAIARG